MMKQWMMTSRHALRGTGESKTRWPHISWPLLLSIGNIFSNLALMPNVNWSSYSGVDQDLTNTQALMRLTMVFNLFVPCATFSVYKATYTKYKLTDS
jgi:hypothetical protein